MLTSFINVHYCYTYLIDQIPVNLLLYAHIPTSLIAILFGSFILYKTRNIIGVSFFMMCISFAVWCLLSLSTWFSFLGSANTMFTWSLIDLFGLVMFFFSYYFLYSFITGKDLPLWQKTFGLLLMLPTGITTFFGANLLSYDSNNCSALENIKVISYLFFAQGVFILAVIVFSVIQYIKDRKDLERRKEIMLLGSGVLLFLLFFFSATLAVALFSESDISNYVYNYEIYGLFGMPILLAFLGYIIVKFKAFNIRLIGAQVLVFGLATLVGANIFTAGNSTNRNITMLTFLFIVLMGINLIRGVKKEIETRERIEKLAEKLEIAGEAQADTIRFISHQIRGVFTATKGALSSILDGDYDPIPENLKTMVQNLFVIQVNGVDSVQAFLSASQLENGNPFTMAETDFKSIASQVCMQLKTKAEQKGLAFEVDIPTDEGYKIMGDKTYLLNAILNVVDNSINYTPAGAVKVSLSKADGSILFSVKDTGVGINTEDGKKMFTKYGHGKDSRLVNVNSNGLGLYFTKKVVDGHHGTIWYESEAGKGTTFFVKLPLIKA